MLRRQRTLTKTLLVPVFAGLLLFTSGCAPYRRGWAQETEVLGNYWSTMWRSNENENNVIENFGGGWHQEKTNALNPVRAAIRQNYREWHAYEDVEDR